MLVFEELFPSVTEMDVSESMFADLQHEMDDANSKMDLEAVGSAVTNEELSRTYSL